MDARVMTLMLLVAMPVLAETPMYRWTDAQGQVHYGDQPDNRPDTTWLNAPPLAAAAREPAPGLPSPSPSPELLAARWERRCDELAAARAIFDRRALRIDYSGPPANAAILRNATDRNSTDEQWRRLKCQEPWEISSTPAPPPPKAIPKVDSVICQSARAERAIYDLPDRDPRLGDPKRRPELIRLRKEAQQRAQQRVVESGCTYSWEGAAAKESPAPVDAREEGAAGRGYGLYLLVVILVAAVAIKVFGPKLGP